MRETGYVQVHVCVCVSLWSETLPAALHKPVMINEASCRQLYHSTCSNKILLKWHHHRWCEEGEPAWTKVLCVLTSHHLGCSAHTAPKSRRHFHDHISGGFQLPIKPLGPHLWWVPTEMTVNPHHKWALRATWQGKILLPPKSQNPWGGGMVWGLEGLKRELGPWQVWGNSLQGTTEEQMGSMVNVSFSSTAKVSLLLRPESRVKTFSISGFLELGSFSSITSSCRCTKIQLRRWASFLASSCLICSMVYFALSFPRMSFLCISFL